MPKHTLKRPRDPNQLAKLIVDIATGEREDAARRDARNPKAVERGHKGGIVGGKARSLVLSPARRKAIAKKAARTRWKVEAEED